MAAAVASSDTRAGVEARRPLVTLCALALLATASVAAAQSQWTPTSAQVTRAIDGEAIEVKIGDRTEIVRYIGISTPEIQLPTRGAERSGEAAKATNARLATGKNVQLVFDVQRRDRFGRLLAYVFAGDSFLNAELVAAGYAEVATYPPNVRHRETFMTRQREARQARRGLWADPDAAQFIGPGPPASSETRDCRFIFIRTTGPATFCSQIRSCTSRAHSTRRRPDTGRRWTTRYSLGGNSRF